MTPTEIQLFVKYREPAVRLDDICDHYLGMTPAVARRRAALNTLPFPTFRASDSAKSPLLVRVGDLAAHLDARHEAAAEEWKVSQL